jgi:hypothetical protein
MVFVTYPRGAGPDQADHVLGGIGDGQREELHLGLRPAQRVEHGPAAAVGHVDVEQHHVRVQAVMEAIASATVPASPTTSTNAPSSARTPARNMA